MIAFDEYIDVDKADIPHSIEIELAGEIYELEFSYNVAHDFFTVDLFKNDVPLVVGEKMILNRPLFRNRVHIDLPKVNIIPKDRAGVATRINYDNFNETVFLYVLKEGETVE